MFESSQNVFLLKSVHRGTSLLLQQSCCSYQACTSCTPNPSIIIDDLIKFKTVPTIEAYAAAGATLSADVAAVCQRYEDVARVRLEKVADYSARQVVAGYQLD